MVHGEPALGVVYNPASDELRVARCSDNEEPGRQAGEGRYLALVGYGEEHLGGVPPLPGNSEIRAVGSVAYRLALVAEGRGDLVVTWYPRQEWDVAAGAALSLAAGLTVTDFLGEPLRFNKPQPLVRGLIVAPADLHARVRSYFDEISR